MGAKCSRVRVVGQFEYFRAANAEPDERMSDALRFIESRRQPDGRWLLDRAYDESLAVTTGESAMEPSRWNTLRALRCSPLVRASKLTGKPASKVS
ncbi:MAG TPA: hypothetical protein VF126_08430 [Acidobacteriaceae bacterium]